MQSLNIMAVNNMAAKNLDEWDVKMDKSQFENWLRERKIFKFSICHLSLEGCDEALGRRNAIAGPNPGLFPQMG